MNSALTHRIRCEELASFVPGLFVTLRHNGYSQENLDTLLNASIHGACVQCGIRLTAQDLASLNHPHSSIGTQDSKIARLQTGFCARKGCDSFYYEFSFGEAPGINWESILGRISNLTEEKTFQTAAESAGLKAARGRKRRIQIFRLLSGLLLLVILLGARHWRNGGSIPIIRELNELKVDPASLRLDGVCPTCGEVH